MLNLFALSHSSADTFRKITEKHCSMVQAFKHFNYVHFNYVSNTKFKAMLLAHCDALRNLNFIHLLNKKCKRKTNKQNPKMAVHWDFIDNFIVRIADQIVL